MSWLDSTEFAPHIVNKRELAELLGVSDQTLSEWQEQGMPVEERGGPGVSGRYNVPACVRWASRREIDKRVGPSSFDRLNLVKAKREEIALQRDLGEVVFVKDIRPGLRRYVSDILGTLLAIPEKHAHILEVTEGVDGKRQVLDDLVAELRDALGSYEYLATPAPGGDPGASQSAEDHSG